MPGINGLQPAIEQLQSEITEIKNSVIEGDGHVRASEAARFLGVSRGSIYSLMESGELAYLRVGRARRIPRSALREFVAKNTVGGC